jgi:hypothetical protein
MSQTQSSALDNNERVRGHLFPGSVLAYPHGPQGIREFLKNFSIITPASFGMTQMREPKRRMTSVASNIGLVEDLRGVVVAVVGDSEIRFGLYEGKMQNMSNISTILPRTTHSPLE